MPSDDVHLRPVSGLDPGQQDLFLAWAAVFEADGRHTFGAGHTDWTPDELRELERSPDRRRLAWAAEVDGAVVGAVGLVMPQHDNLTMAGINLAVHPERRRRGIGTVLLRHAEEQALAHGRSLLMGETQWPHGATDDSGERFAALHGYAAAQTVVRSTLTLPAGPERFEAVLADATDDGYSLRSCWDGIPQEWLAGRAELSRRMSTDVPLGDLRLEEEAWDAERVRTEYARIAAMGRRVVDTFAVEASTGALVGFTQVQVGEGSDLGYQQDTLVVREHRGHRLGLRLKAASTLAVKAELPAVARIRTWNADDNAPMLAVNRELGYEADAWLREWQKVVP